MIYLLICISNTDENISSVNYLDAKTDLSILNNRFTALKIYGVDTLSQEVSYGEFNILTNPMYAFNKDDSGNLYINNKATNKHKAEAIASFLFENTSITELIELILFYKDIELIKEESAEEDIARISQRWLPDYEDKYQSFQNDIRSNFPELPRDDEKWYIYNESHKSKFLIQLVNTGRLHELQNSISDCKKNYEDYFDNFHEEIDNAAIIRMAAEFLCFLEGKENVELDLINRIHKLSKELGSEEDLSSIRKYLSESYTDFAEQKIALHKLTEKEMKIEFQNRIDKIYNSLPTVLNKDISKDILHGGFSVAVSLTKKTKVINFHNANFTFNQQQEFEATGASGEIEVLYLLLEEFLRLDIFNQRKAIDEICDLLYKECKLELEEQKHNIYEVMNDVDLLKKALIPLFYITMHNKYLSVDLIGYINGKATLFEVKTTKFNNNKFYLSIAEVQVARKYKDQYVIVRVSDNKINFIGNPFFEFDDKITKIKYDGFIIQPRTFEFIFTN